MRVVPITGKLTSGREDIFRAQGVQNKAEMQSKLTRLGVVLAPSDPLVQAILSGVKDAIQANFTDEKIERIVAYAETKGAEINAAREEDGKPSIPVADHSLAFLGDGDKRRDIRDTMYNAVKGILLGTATISSTIEMEDDSVPVEESNGDPGEAI